MINLFQIKQNIIQRGIVMKKPIEQQIAELTLLMNKAAQELEFEQAAHYRDEITRIKKQNDLE